MRVIDTGRLAVWMRPEPAGGVTISLYAAEYFDDGAEVWIVRVPRGSRIPYEVIDKPHRIRWVMHAEPGSGFEGEVLEHRTVGPSHHGHRRLASRRHLWRWPLPPRILRALHRDGAR